MLSVLLIVLPIFALIGAGWIARRSGVLGPHATGEINRFVVWLALPALLFDIVAKARWSDIWQPGFIAVFGIGAADPCGGMLDSKNGTEGTDDPLIAGADASPRRARPYAGKTSKRLFVQVSGRVARAKRDHAHATRDCMF